MEFDEIDKLNLDADDIEKSVSESDLDQFGVWVKNDSEPEIEIEDVDDSLSDFSSLDDFESEISSTSSDSALFSVPLERNDTESEIESDVNIDLDADMTDVMFDTEAVPEEDDLIQEELSEDTVAEESKIEIEEPSDEAIVAESTETEVSSENPPAEEDVDLTDFLDSDDGEIDLDEFLTDESSASENGDIIEEEPIDMDLVFTDEQVEEESKSEFDDIFDDIVDETSDSTDDSVPLSEFGVDFEAEQSDTSKSETKDEGMIDINPASFDIDLADTTEVSMDEFNMDFEVDDNNKDDSVAAEGKENKVQDTDSFEIKFSGTQDTESKEEPVQNNDINSDDEGADFVFNRDDDDGSSGATSISNAKEMSEEEKEKALEDIKNSTFEDVEFDFLDDSSSIENNNNVDENEKTQLTTDTQETDMSVLDDFSTENLDESLNDSISFTDDLSDFNLDSESTEPIEETVVEQTSSTEDSVEDSVENDLTFSIDEDVTEAQDDVMSEDEGEIDIPVTDSAESDLSDDLPSFDGIDDFSFDNTKEPADETGTATESEPDLSIDETVAEEISTEEVPADEALDDFAITTDVTEPSDDQETDEKPGLDSVIANDPVESAEISFEEPSFDEIPTETESSEINEAGAAIISQMAAELKALREELSSLRSEFDSLKASKNNEVCIEQEEIPEFEQKENEQATSGFFDDDEDETIALSGDELNNILNTADFTTEVVEADESIDSSMSEEDALSEYDSDSESEVDSTLTFSENEQVPDLDTNPMDIIDDDSEETEDNAELNIGNGLIVESDTNDFIKSIETPTPSIEESLSDENIDYLEETSDVEPIAETASVSTDIENPEVQKDIKSVLAYMDQLLESLPESKIEEFAKSEHFETYKKLFNELGISE